MELLDNKHFSTSYKYNHELRLYNDTTTWLSEVLNGSMRTTFEYNFDGQELYSSDGTGLKVIFDEAVANAITLPPHLHFEKRRRKIELDEYYDMLAMMRSDDVNTIIVVSDFPPELTNANNDVGGYNVSRKTTMLRILTKTAHNSLVMTSQSLDGSDRKALESIYHYFGLVPNEGELLGQRILATLDPESQSTITDTLTHIYDNALQQRYGGRWYAGRYQSKDLNTYDFVRQQSDLIMCYVEAVRNFGENQSLLGSIAAALQHRYDQFVNTNTSFVRTNTGAVSGFCNHSIVYEEIQRVINQGLVSNMTFSGCGLTINRSENIRDELLQLGYGNQSQEDKYGPLSFKCQRGHINKRPPNKLIDKCTTCGISVKC